MDDKLKDAQRFLDFINKWDNLVTPDELTQAFEKVIRFVSDSHLLTKEEVARIEKVINEKYLDFQSNNSKDIEEFKKRLSEIQGNMVDSVIEGLRKRNDETIAGIETYLEGIRDELDPVNMINKLIPFIPPAERITGERIVAELEMLPKGRKLNINDLDGVEELKDKLKNLAQKPFMVGAGSSGGGSVKVYDLSADLDGVTKTFNTPAMSYVVALRSSSNPQALRPDVDYTYTDSTVTFTSEINAETVLAAGQSMVLVYAEA